MDGSKELFGRMLPLFSPRSPSEAVAQTPRMESQSMTQGRSDRGSSSDLMETARGPRSEDNSNIRYLGSRLNGLKHGNGMQIWADGRNYRGQFEDGQFHGSGAMSWPDGRTYRGQYVEGRKHGEGVFCWPDGRMYSGQWVRGRRDGRGMYVNAKGESGEGLWADDCPCSWAKSSMDKFQSTSATRSVLSRETAAPSSCDTRSPCSNFSATVSTPRDVEMPIESLPTLLQTGPGKIFPRGRTSDKTKRPWEDDVCEERPSACVTNHNAPVAAVRSIRKRASCPNMTEPALSPSECCSSLKQEITEIDTESTRLPQGLGSKVGRAPNRTGPLLGQRVTWERRKTQGDFGASSGQLNFLSLLEFWHNKDKTTKLSERRADDMATHQSQPVSSRPSPRASPQLRFGPTCDSSDSRLRTPRQPGGDRDGIS